MRTIAICSLLCVTASPAFGATISEVRSETQDLVVMENAFVRLTVDMRHGAKVTRMLYKPLQREWLVSGQSLFADHVWQQTWPGELFDVPYEHQIVERGPKRVAVKVWRTLQRKGKKNVIGVKVERTLILREGSPVVTAEVTLSNPTEADKTVGYWSQHIFRLGGLSDNFYIRPSSTGHDVATFDYRDEGRIRQRVGDEWVKSPVAGWSAVVNPTTSEAAVFLMDYNDLRWLYNCISSRTTEWYYDLLRMPPGGRWTTRIHLLPLRGYRGVSFASRQVVADIRLVPCREGYRLAYTVGCGEAPLKNVALSATVTGAESKQAIGRDSASFEAVGRIPSEFLSAVTVPAEGEPFLVEATLAGDGFKQTFRKHFGDYNRTGRLVAGEFDTGYSTQPPRKHKTLDRPANLRILPHEGTAVYEARGQFFPGWRLKEALATLGKHTFRAGHFSSNVYGEQLDYFPAGYQGIMGYDVIVLNNVSAAALSPNDQALLVDYVRHGGGLLVLGGWYAFGGGQYAESALADVLPVECGKPFDIRPHRPGLAVAPGTGNLFDGLDLGEKPVVLWHQEVPGLKKGAQVLLTAGGKPFVVSGTFGKGRVACVLGSVTGTATAGGKPFFECRVWPQVLGRLLKWLGRGGALK